MLSKVTSATVTGIDSFIVQVEVDLSNGIPYFAMTGYLGTQVKEAGERVRTALKNIGYRIPSSRIVVNISPASFRKSGTMFDLPIAVGILCDMKALTQECLKDTMIVGELSLDGRINGIRGILPMIAKASEEGIRRVIVPKDNLNEAQLIETIELIGVTSLEEVLAILKDDISVKSRIQNTKRLPLYPLSGNDNDTKVWDFSQIAGQYTAKRAALIAAAGRHNLLLSGAPGSGKTLIAGRIPTILPELSRDEYLEVMKIYSVSGLLNEVQTYLGGRPFRAPHHTISQSALLGGGSYPLPGEITLAHNGILFLDELTKFKSNILECLRQPLEDKQITIIRNSGTFHYPADFMLVGAMNPCKCGYYPDRNLCRCTDLDIARHIGRLSGPFLDRFDLAVQVDVPQYEEISGIAGKSAIGEMMRRVCEPAANQYGKTVHTVFCSDTMKEMVQNAVQIQRKRYQNMKIQYNSQLNTAYLKKFCVLDDVSDELLHKAYEQYHFSARAYTRILRVARTIADLEHSERICASHVSEAICFRNINFLAEK